MNVARRWIALLTLAACTPDLEAAVVTPLTTPPAGAGASAEGIALREGVGIAVRIDAYTDDPSEATCTTSLCRADPCASDACDPSLCDASYCSDEPCSARACDASRCDPDACDPDPCVLGACSPDECLIESTTCTDGPLPLPPESLRFSAQGDAFELWEVESGVLIVVGRRVGAGSVVVRSVEAGGTIAVPVDVSSQ